MTEDSEGKAETFTPTSAGSAPKTNEDSSYFIVVIDDERTLPLSEIPVLLYRNSDDGLAILKEFKASDVRLDELWLDHDLGEDPSKRYGFDTIMPVVAWLEEQGHNGDPLDVGVIFVHTMNAAMAPVMMDALRPYYTVIRTPFPS